MAARGYQGLIGRPSKTTLLVFAATALALAPAPASSQGTETATTCTDDAVVVFDASGSMASAGYNELEVPRIFDAIEAMRRVLPQVTALRRIGLVVYGPGARDACSNIELKLAPEFNSADTIISELEALKPNGDTPLSEAVAAAAEVMDYRNRPAVVVLVTDGEETCGGVPCEVAGRLHSEGRATTVHVIGFKVRGRFFDWRSQEPQSGGDSASRCLADVTGGLYVSTETTDELAAALKETLGCPIVTRAPG